MPMEPPPPPRISVAIAVFTPTTSPRALTSGPPELPGLIDASVCSAVLALPSPMRTSRFSALTMPPVTVPCRPSGEPSASTGSPTRTSENRPNVSGAGLCPAGIASTARSRAGSEPATRAGMRRRSASATVTWPPSSTTCALVSTWPCRSMTNPEPVPRPFPDRTSIDTTLAWTRAATSLRSPPPFTGPAPDCDSAVDAGSPAVTRPATPPASSAATTARPERPPRSRRSPP
jgi:hypothetical protein